MADYIQVVTTTSNKAYAETVARALVEQRLAACVQIVGPITSLYWWQGQIEHAEEFQCWIKTRADLFERLAEAIRAVHPYSVPEILAMPVTAGNPGYLEWMDQELAPRSASG